MISIYIISIGGDYLIGRRWPLLTIVSTCRFCCHPNDEVCCDEKIKAQPVNMTLRIGSDTVREVFLGVEVAEPLLWTECSAMGRRRVDMGWI